MAYVKSASEELLEIAVRLSDKMTKVRRLPNDDDYDAGYKDGARETLNDAIHMIHARLEELLGKE